MKSNSLVQSYKCGFIHSTTIDGYEVIRIQVDPYAYPIHAKSFRAAKIAITKHLKSGKALFKKENLSLLLNGGAK